MSWHLQPADRAPGTNGANGPNGPHGAHAAQGADDEPHGAPNVYHPQADAAPAYEEYADPAAAHGWENAYDSTRELPVTVRDADDDPAGPGGPAFGGGPRRRARPKGRGRPTTRVLVAVGAVCALGAAVAIAGFSGSGSPGGPQVEGDGVRPKAERSEPSVGASAPTGAAATGPSDGGAPSVTARPSDDVSATAGASVTPSSSGEETGAPTTSAPSAGATATASADVSASVSASRPGNSGHGKGSGKRPR
ncbi:hypothetical protein ACWGDT_26570 [Streptomyces avermitilis]